MLALWQALLLAVSSTLDDLGVGFSLGLRGRVPLFTATTVAVISGLTMIVGLYSGQALAGLLTARTADYLSAAVFFSFAVWFGREGHHRCRERDERQEMSVPGASPAAPRSAAGQIGAIILGLGLGINSVGLGVSGGMAGFPVPLTAGLTAGTSFVFFWYGSRFGASTWIRRVMGNMAPYGSAALMLALGILQLT